MLKQVFANCTQIWIYDQIFFQSKIMMWNKVKAHEIQTGFEESVLLKPNCLGGLWLLRYNIIPTFSPFLISAFLHIILVTLSHWPAL